MILITHRSIWGRLSYPASERYALHHTDRCSNERRMFAALILAAGVAAQQAASTVITNVTVVDVVSGRTMPDRHVLIRGARIAAISAGSARPSSAATRIDGKGKFLIPGLWEGHGHVDEHGEWQLP